MYFQQLTGLTLTVRCSRAPPLCPIPAKRHPKPHGLVKDHGARIGVPGHRMYSYLDDQQIWLGILGSVW